MRGTVTIVCDETGTHIKTDLKDMSEHDPLFLVHALGKSLDLGYHDYAVIGIAEIEGVLDKEPNTVTTFGGEEIVYES